MNKTYDELLKYYSNATKEQVIEDMLLDNNRIYDGFLATQEELTNYAKENEKLHSIIKEVRELLKNDYFEDGSFTNYKKVFELLDEENK